jgi:hypothetical protein
MTLGWQSQDWVQKGENRDSGSQRASPWRASGGPSAARRLSLRPVNVWETILYFAVPTVALYLGIALLVVAPRMARRPRYRVGQPWPHGPMWWTANPEGAHLPAADHPADHGPAPAGVRAGSERGGARGSW